MTQLFGALVRRRRGEMRISLRGCARKAAMDPGNLSKIERGLERPPQDEAVLDRICAALVLGATEARHLKDIALLDNGRIPSDILENDDLMASIPALLRPANYGPPSIASRDEEGLSSSPELDFETMANICRKNDIERLRLFGSFARGDSRESSDIDLIAEFSTRKSLLDLVRIEREFAERLGRDVDLLTDRSMSPHLREQVTREARVVYERAA